MARPPCKRVGGKGKLLPQLLPLVPQEFGRYDERFFGGGAMFFALRDRIKSARVSDADPHLINLMMVIRDDVEHLIRRLSSYSYNENEYYYTRRRFNTGIDNNTERAAALLYMNKTCMNGLWRVNRSGRLNAPWGRYDNPTICDASNLRACSAALQGVEIVCADFEIDEADIQAGDFVFLDSPYVPESGKSSFVAYTAAGFADADHVRLAGMFRRLAARGAHVMLTNGDTPRTRELYTGFPILSTSRSGNVNSDPTKRQRVPEVLILSGTWKLETTRDAAQEESNAA